MRIPIIVLILFVLGVPAFSVAHEVRKECPYALDDFRLAHYVVLPTPQRQMVLRGHQARKYLKTVRKFYPNGDNVKADALFITVDPTSHIVIVVPMFGDMGCKGFLLTERAHRRVMNRLDQGKI